MIVLGEILIVFGVALILLAAIGILRLPDVFSRMHAGTKAASLGLAFVLTGVALLLPGPATGIKVALAIFFQFWTAPVAAHMIGRAAYRSGIRLWEGTRYDELRDRLEGDEQATTTAPDEGTVG